jgi:hemolysin D
VPIDSHLEIEAMVSNRDIGFVYAGQEAEIKIDTFSFTRYGLLHGKVVSVSQDAITREKAHRQTR